MLFVFSLHRKYLLNENIENKKKKATISHKTEWKMQPKKKTKTEHYENKTTTTTKKNNKILANI